MHVSQLDRPFSYYYNPQGTPDSQGQTDPRLMKKSLEGSLYCSPLQTPLVSHFGQNLALMNRWTRCQTQTPHSQMLVYCSSLEKEDSDTDHDELVS